MNTMKLLVAGLLIAATLSFNALVDTAVQPEAATQLALEQFVSPSLATNVALLNTEAVLGNLQFGLVVFTALVISFMYRKTVLSYFRKPAYQTAALVMLCLCLSGCRKPYHEKLYVDLGTSEIGILAITMNDEGQAVLTPPGKGDSTKANANATNYYAERVVNAKRVEIPYFWKQTSRVYTWNHSGNGKWAPAARLLVVDTAPEIRRWSGNTGLSAESEDSVGFSTGFSVAARIANREDALLFLSNYPPELRRNIQTEGGDAFEVEITSLKQIMDEEMKTKIQEFFTDATAETEMDALRTQKNEVLNVIRDKTVPYFKERGITITSIGQFGGYSYENPAIQTSIDAIFQAQQDKERAIAETEAASERKSALQLIGEGEAAKAIAKAEGEAAAVELLATAEATAITKVADAKSYELSKLKEDPEAYLELKKLEVEMARLEAWDGSYPTTLMGGGAGAVPLLNLK